jgi:hypothetical protein
MAKKFKDIFKNAHELFGKDFPQADGDNFAIDVETKFKSNDKVTVTNKLSKSGSGNKVSGSLEPKYKDKDITISGSFSTENEHSATVKYNIEGATVGISGSSKGDDVDVRGTFDYVDDKFTVGFGVSHPYAGGNPIKGAASLTFAYENLIVGAAYGAEYCHENGLGDNDTSLALLLNGNGYSLGFYANKVSVKKEETAKIKLGYTQTVNQQTTAGAGFSVDTKGDVGIVLASHYLLDNQSSLRSRIHVHNQKDLNIGFVYKQRLNDIVEVSLGADLDSTSLLAGTSGKHKFQLKLNLLD